MFIYEVGLEIAGTDVISSSRLVEVRQRDSSTAGEGGVGSEKKGASSLQSRGSSLKHQAWLLIRDKHLFQRILTRIPITY